jgi:hypothetical protein
MIRCGAAEELERLPPPFAAQIKTTDVAPPTDLYRTLFKVAELFCRFPNRSGLAPLGFLQMRNADR